MAVSRAVFGQLAEIILEGGARQATKYLSERETVKATRPTYGGKFLKSAHTTIVFTVGRPNYAERKFIRQAKEAGEPFPIRKIQVRWLKTNNH